MGWADIDLVFPTRHLTFTARSVIWWFSLKLYFMAKSFLLARLVQLCQSDSAYRCSNLRKAFSNDAHNRDIPVNKSLERLPYPECHHHCLGAGFDRCSCSTVYRSSPLGFHSGTLCQSGILYASTWRISINLMKESLYDTIGVFNILTDAAIFLLSICMMWDVHVHTRKRFVVVTSFSMRLLWASALKLLGLDWSLNRVCGATIAQLVTLRPYFKSLDQTCTFNTKSLRLTQADCQRSRTPGFNVKPSICNEFVSLEPCIFESYSHIPYAHLE